ncbi:Protein TolQ [Nitrospira sp. KM1]|uniref:MotA/TolQ/ExbB proton channel family protein n=1 Tax=Nitrospira sp. KM1 TaxID=1936990 RepID=UPI0013A730CB|nr:MotA/TolQ/ExbB proton channel family protein [Nitrospira sp. KM1]BCA54411.1 Protein TolQ [Nitrospira sp. KM1]
MFQSGLTGAFGSLGGVSKIVLLVLFVFSVISWAIIFSKWRAFKAADRGDRHFMGLLAKAHDLNELHHQVRHVEASPSAIVFEGVMDRLSSMRNEGQDGSGSGAMDRHIVERTAAHLSQSQLSRLEAYLPFLATTGNITPFVGLLGTVMGIIDAFKEIGSQGTASIAAVAPGVAEALIATAAGLFAAIPAVIAYNYFLTRIRRTAFRLDTVSIELMGAVPVVTPKAKPVPVGAQR